MSNPQRMQRAADVAASVNPLSFVARRFTGEASPASEDATTREAVNRLQQIIDVAGLIDQSGVADLSNTLVSLMRAVDEPQARWQHLRNAAMSSISALPLFGDFAKFGKQYRAAAHGASLAEAAMSPAAREAGKAAGQWASQHPGATLAFVTRAVHLLNILAQGRKQDKTHVQMAMDILGQMRGAYSDYMTDPGVREIATREFDRHYAAWYAKAYPGGDAGEEEYDDEVGDAGEGLPEPPEGPPVAAGASGSTSGGGGGAGSRPAPVGRMGRFAQIGLAAAGGAAIAHLATRRKRRGSRASFSARGSGRVFWGRPPGAEAYEPAGAAGMPQDDAPDDDDIRTPEGPGWFRRAAGRAMRWTPAGLAARAWWAGNRAVTGMWGVPGAIGRKMFRTAGQVGAFGPLGMLATGGPAALIRENRDLISSVTGVVRGFKELIQTTERTNNYMMQLQDHLVQYSGAMASAKAQYIADQIRRDMDMARQTGGSYAGMTRAQSALQDRLVKYKAAGTNLNNVIGNAWARLENIGLAIIEHVTGIDKIISLINHLSGGSGVGDPPVINLIRDIADGKYDSTRRPRRPPGG